MAPKLVEAYDRAGIDAYHLAEHHSTPLGMAPCPSVFLSAVAQRTKRLRFGPMVYTLSLYHPLRVMEEICMLDQMSGGRFELGVGRGISPIEIALLRRRSEAIARHLCRGARRRPEAFQTQTLDSKASSIASRTCRSIIAPLQKPHPPLWYGVLEPESADWPAPSMHEHRDQRTGGADARNHRRYRAAWQMAGRDPAKCRCSA